MKSAFYAGASGLLAQQQKMNAIGNNLANVNTVGYKNQVVAFEDLLYQSMYVNPMPERDLPLTGHGVRATDAGIDFIQAGLRETQFELDFAIVGDGLFAVDKNGQRMYTRDGEFVVKLQGETAYLATQDGGNVLNAAGQPITLQRIAGQQKYNTANLKDEIGLYRFDNPNALSPMNGNRFLATENSGAAQLVTDASSKIKPGFIENSATQVADEMSNMISAQRGYQISARVVQVSDENEQTINNLRK